jgi:WD40 repeat protein
MCSLRVILIVFAGLATFAQVGRSELFGPNVSANRTDCYGAQLPPGALARMGCIAFADAFWQPVYTPDGKVIIAAGQNGIHFWEVATGKELRLIEKDKHNFWSPCLTQDGKMLAAGEDKVIRLWEAETGREIQTLRGHADYVRAFALSRDGKVLASTTGDKTVWLWDTASGKVRHILRGHQLPVKHIALSPDGKVLASGDEDETAIPENGIDRERTIRLWDVTTGKELPTHPSGQKNSLYGMAFSPDGKKLAVASGHAPLQVWEVATGRMLFTCEGKSISNFAVFSPDGRLLAGGIYAIQLWDATTGREVVNQNFLRGFSSLAFAPDSKIIALTGLTDDSRIHFWDIAAGTEVIRVPGGHLEKITSLVSTPDGKTLITGSLDKTIRFWDARTGKELRVLRGHQNGIYALAMSPDGKTLASAEHNRRSGDETAPAIHLWDVPTGKPLRQLPSGDDGESVQLAFSTDGRTLAATSHYGVQFWDVTTGRPGRLLNNAKGAPSNQGWWASGFAFSPDGQTLVMAGSGGNDRTNPNYGKTVRFWDMATGKLLWDLPRNSCDHPVAYSPDGRLLLAGYELWDLKTVRLLHRIQGVRYHPLQRWNPLFSPDGAFLAAPSREAIQVWEVATGQEILHLRGHLSDVSSVAFGMDSQTLVSASSDCTALVWDLLHPPSVNVLPVMPISA